MKLHIDGIVPIIPTPFDETEAIAWADLDRLIDFAIEARACAVCLPAYASEFYKLSEQERLEVVRRAVLRAAGRIPVIAQVNYPSSRLAIEAAARAIEAGASAIASAAPRMFALADQDIIRYFSAILESIDVSFMLQDFNPGGPSLSVSALAELNAKYPHFCYVKLEEPRLASKVEAIREATGGRLGVLEGWGGMYTLELVAAGIAGVVPGLGLTDLLHRVFHLAKSGRGREAQPIFEAVLPQIVFSLQNLELFHHAEKLLLRDRGVLSNTTVRSAALRLTQHDLDYISFLNDRIVRVAGQQGLPVLSTGTVAGAGL